jgi:hypothetical protein
MSNGNESRRRRRVVVFGAAVLLLESVAMKLRGFKLGGKLVVRCREGHLFTTIWLPGGLR